MVVVARRFWMLIPVTVTVLVPGATKDRETGTTAWACVWTWATEPSADALFAPNRPSASTAPVIPIFFIGSFIVL
jgi:hypothetical protein